ncbi:hypothetical protein ACOSP7_020811 [Xanthoceras sorbifolium]
MEGLQRSAVSFRRQGSSGMVWDDKFLSELNQMSKQKEEQDQLQLEQQQDSQPPEHEKTDNNNNIKEVKPSISINTTIERSRSNGGGGRGYRTGRVSPAIEPPSPRVSACGFCSAFAKPSKTLTKKSGKRRSR